MSVLNSLLRPVFDLLQVPFRGLPPIVGVLVWSVPTAVFALWIFKKFSNQDQIAEVKRRIQAGLFEIRLFNDDLRAILRAQGEILKHVLHYQWLAIKPMIWILPPLVLVMVHLHMFYGFRPLQPGEDVLVTAVVRGDTSPTPPDLELELPEGLAFRSESVWSPGVSEMTWRIAAFQDGDYDLVLRLGGEEVTKSVTVGGGVTRLSPERPDGSFLAQLEYPSEAPVPADGPFGTITVAYPEAVFEVLWWDWQWAFAWMVWFFIATMVVALALKGPMGVEL
jgi:uncharacterized membrane protein (DUF106 family)